MISALPDRPVKSILAIFIVVNAIFLLAMPLLPFIDLPNHLAEATIYKYYGTSGNNIAQYYQPTPWYFPNTFHTVFCSLFPTVELGNKVFHILYIIILQVSVYLVIKQLNGNPWFGLLAILFTYGYNVTYGFVGYAISTATLIILFYFTLRDIKEDKVWLKAVIAFLLVMLFLMHAQNALFGLLLYGLMMLYRYRTSFKKLFIRAVFIPLPLVALIFAWWFTRDASNEESTGGYLLKYYTSDYFRDFGIRLRLIVFDNFQLREGMPGIFIAVLLFACIILPLLYFKPWKNTMWRSLLHSEGVYALIFLITSFACYLFLPDKLPGQTPLSQRFCSLVMLSFIVFASMGLNKTQSAGLKYFVLIVAVGYTALWFEYIYSFNNENRNFNKNLFAGLDNHSRLGGLIYDNKYRGRKVYIHYPNYFLVWNKGIVTSKIIDYRFGVVKRVASESEIPFYNELIGEGYKTITQYAHLEYLLVRGKAPVTRDVNLENFAPVQHLGQWRLYRNKKLAAFLTRSSTLTAE